MDSEISERSGFGVFALLECKYFSSLEEANTFVSEHDGKVIPGAVPGTEYRWENMQVSEIAYSEY